MMDKAKKLQSDKQRCSLKGAVKGLEERLSKLAPHPDKPGQHGPVLIETPHSACSGLSGGFMLDGLLGIAFGSVTGGLGFAVEAYDEICRDRMTGRTNGEYELGEKSKLTGAFKAHASGMDQGPGAPGSAFMADYKERVKIERQMARFGIMLEKLDLPDKYGYQSALQG